MDGEVLKKISFFGSFKSPDMATPAVNPVTAGKNIAKTTSSGTEFSEGTRLTDSGANSVVPKKIDNMDKMMAASIKNWAFKATEVLMSAKMVSESKAKLAVTLKSLMVMPRSKYSLKLSENPIR